jgi:hypothetical protein
MHFIITTRDQQHTVIVENIAPPVSAQVVIETCGWWYVQWDVMCTKDYYRFRPHS